MHACSLQLSHDFINQTLHALLLAGCPLGQEKVVATGFNGTCVNCAAGKAGGGGLSFCSKCLATFYSPTPGAAACTPCPFGSNNTGTGKTRCDSGFQGFSRWHWQQHRPCVVRRPLSSAAADVMRTVVPEHCAFSGLLRPDMYGFCAVPQTARQGMEYDPRRPRAAAAQRASSPPEAPTCHARSASKASSVPPPPAAASLAQRALATPPQEAAVAQVGRCYPASSCFSAAGISAGFCRSGLQ
jgi:hypothetical protein